MARTPEEEATTVVNFAFVGLTDMWKKVQESLSGTSMTALTQSIVANTQRAIQQGEEANGTLGRIADNTARGAGPARAG